MAEGTIESVHEFVEEMSRFLELSESVNDNWQIKNVEENDLSTWYLYHTATVQLHSGPDEVQDEFVITSGAEHQEMMEDDPSSLSCAKPCKAYQFEYHVVYSASYSVPVLYFNCYKTNGSLVGLEELWETVPSQYRDRITEERWATLTQQEHPLLGRPFYQLHPCHTASLMKQVQQSSPYSYILSWLSSVGPLVHLNLPVVYAEAANRLSEKKKT